jgi:hypothetical protein
MMLRKQKNIISLFLVVLFITPTVTRIFHHHDYFVCIEKNVKHFHKNHPKCEICNFEFSLYNAATTHAAISRTKVNCNYSNGYTSAVFIEQNLLSFSLRAPPLV